MKEVEEGQIFEIEGGVKAIVAKIYTKFRVLMMDTQGNICWTSAKKVLAGDVRLYKPLRKEVIDAKKARKFVVQTETINKEREDDSRSYSVYMATLFGTPIYIGSGKKDRWKHCTSGSSHNVMLNRICLAGLPLECKIMAAGLSQQESLDMESDMIKKFNPYANIQGKVPQE